MPQTSKYSRLLDGGRKPTAGEIAAAVGKKALPNWDELSGFLKANYDFDPEFIFYGAKYGWCYKYRRKSKTLCVLFPESGAFTVLVTLGKKEVAEVEAGLSRFNDATVDLFRNAYQFHDGKWLYKRVLNKSDLKDVKTLITIKKKPRAI